MNEQKDRKGDKFEREMEDMFRRIGFTTRNHVFTEKNDGRKSEQDILAEKGGIKVLIQCKDYAKFPNTEIENVIEDLVEDGGSLNADKLVLAITGYRDISRWREYAKENGVYLWNEAYWRKLQSLDLYDLIFEIGKSLEIEDILRRVSKQEEDSLNEIYENIKTIKDPQRRGMILKSLENIPLSDKNKKRTQLKRIENEVLSEKESEIGELNKKIEEQNKAKTEDIELEEIFNLLGSSELDYNKRYKILEKIKRELNLSQKSGRLIDFEKIKTFLEKQQDDSSNECWGDKTYLNLEGLMEEGKLSEKDKQLIQEKIGQTIGISKKGYTESQKIEIGRIIKQAIIKNKIYKISIGVILFLIIDFILWRILF